MSDVTLSRLRIALDALLAAGESDPALLVDATYNRTLNDTSELLNKRVSILETVHSTKTERAARRHDLRRAV